MLLSFMWGKEPVIGEDFQRGILVGVTLPDSFQHSAHIKGPKVRERPGLKNDRSWAWSLHAHGTYVISAGQDSFVLTVTQHDGITLATVLTGKEGLHPRFSVRLADYDPRVGDSEDVYISRWQQL